MASRRTARRFVLIALVLLALIAAAGFYFTRDEKTQQKLADSAQRELIKAEIQATKATIKKYDEFLKFIRDAKQSGTKPKYQGYDGFSYDKESEYQAAKDEQERRLADLQRRLDSAYDR